MTTYIFIDESGDPGDIKDDGSNSKYYAELALEINSNEWYQLSQHINNWRYIKGIFYEVKKFPKGKDLDRFLTPISLLHQEGFIRCSCIYFR